MSSAIFLAIAPLLRVKGPNNFTGKGYRLLWHFPQVLSVKQLAVSDQDLV